MKVIIIHGDHTINCRNRLRSYIKRAKEKNYEIFRYSKDSNKQISELLVSKNLFNNKGLYILEDFNTLTNKEMVWLKDNVKDLEGILLIYYKGDFKKYQKYFTGDVKIEVYKLPQLLWKMLDSFLPQNEKEFINLLTKVIKKENEEFVFSLFSRHIKDLYWIKINGNSIPYQPWRVGKLKKQSKEFKKLELKDIISHLAKADIKAKTSRANIIDLLDLIAIKSLQ